MESFGYGALQSPEAAQEDLRATREAMEAAFQTVFRTPQGEQVLIFLYNYCHQMRSTYIAGDPYATAFLEGRRDVALTIMRYLHVDDLEIINKWKAKALRSGT